MKKCNIGKKRSGNPAVNRELWASNGLTVMENRLSQMYIILSYLNANNQIFD